MPALSTRKLFSESVTIGAATATSLAALMRTAGWGFLSDANNAIGTQGSLDSFMANQCLITPATAILYVGHDAFVRNAAAAGPPRLYAGYPIAIAATLNLTQNTNGIVDAEVVYLYSVGSQQVGIVFYGI